MSATETTTCSTCGAVQPASMRFCPECGSRLGEEQGPAQDVRTFGVPPEAVGEIGRRLASVRDRGRALIETVSAQSQARRELMAIRLELEQLHGERSHRLRDLGEAVYGEDEAGTEKARAAVRALDERIAAKEAEMTQVAERTQERVEQARAETRPTELLEPPAQPSPPEPYPPATPEPYPPPDEGTPPTPAPVPEPYPPPDEADPPRQI